MNDNEKYLAIWDSLTPVQREMLAEALEGKSGRIDVVVWWELIDLHLANPLSRDRKFWLSPFGRTVLTLGLASDEVQP